jgi:hypothetical protein
MAPGIFNARTQETCYITTAKTPKTIRDKGAMNKAKAYPATRPTYDWMGLKTSVEIIMSREDNKDVFGYAFGASDLPDVTEDGRIVERMKTGEFDVQFTDERVTEAEGINRDFARVHKLIYVISEVGLGRPCVGFVIGESFLEYNPVDKNDEPLPKYFHPSPLPIDISNVYEIAKCMCVLVTEDFKLEQAVIQLAKWVEQYEMLGVKCVKGPFERYYITMEGA